MAYSIKEVAELTGLSINTLRYYDKVGLLPDIKRTEAGYRVFYEFDLEVIRTIQLFKKSGLSIEDIKRYMTLFAEGESSIDDRLALLYEQKNNLLDQMAIIQHALDELDNIIDYNKEVKENDSEQALRNKAKKLLKVKNKNKDDE